jgi:hypothetical protein
MRVIALLSFIGTDKMFLTRFFLLSILLDGLFAAILRLVFIGSLP